MWEVPQHLTAGRAEGDGGEGGQTLAAVCLCGSVGEYVFGKSEHSHWGYPQIRPLSPADSKLLGKAWSALSSAYYICVIPFGDCFRDSLTAVRILDDVDLTGLSIHPQESSACSCSFLGYILSLPSPVPADRPHCHSHFSFSWNPSTPSECQNLSLTSLPNTKWTVLQTPAT